MLARRKMRSKELAERIGITEQNVSLLKSGKVKGVRFETLERICEALECQPGDILEFRADKSRLFPPGRACAVGRQPVAPVEARRRAQPGPLVRRLRLRGWRHRLAAVAALGRI